ncbi:hypothetical protein AVEN_220429-2 [Araneus ventricosus]|uniref:EGF-like domain-containing protein n=1 Tax=Araneus ventricosus TaxID=182803 RepID=A0A4Y2IPT7_ARAVE|nr:hypothetical protein AVEN_220429-2 [Araneus ventricosus]
MKPGKVFPECDCGPRGSCFFEFGQKKCLCSPFSTEKNGKCIVTETSTSISTDSSSFMTTILPSTISACHCGPATNSCFLDSSGDKNCSCFSGYTPVNGHCVECNCGPRGRCSFESGKKKCVCEANAAENDGKCEKCNCGPYGSCGFEYGKKKCDCRSFAIEKNGVCVVMDTTSSEDTTVVTSTIQTSTTQKCNCGPYGSCSFEYGQKKCHCLSFAIEKNGVCVVIDTTSSEDTTVVTSTIPTSTTQNCNCGVNSISCFYRRDGTKLCNCDFGYIQEEGHCTAICSEDKCEYGKCEVIGSGFKCRCNEGFTGRRCEDKIETKLNKEDLWKIMQVSLIFAMFVLLSGVLCSMTRILNKIPKMSK